MALISEVESHDLQTEAPVAAGARGALTLEHGVVAGRRGHWRCGLKCMGGEGGLACGEAAAASSSICAKKGFSWSFLGRVLSERR